jgi:cytoskeletal protein RodZ
MNDELNFKNFLEEKLKDRGWNLKRLSEVSGISLNHLENLINENFKALPAAPYIRGYLIRLSKILEFDYVIWWEYFQKQNSIKKSGEKDKLPRNRFEPKSIFKPILIALISLFIIFYIVLRFNFIFGKPIIEVNIGENILNTNEQNFVLQGEVKNADKVFVNSSETNINSNGQFKKEILLQPGINTIEIRAQKILGKETKLIRQIFYEEKNKQNFSIETSSNIMPSTTTPLERNIGN